MLESLPFIADPWFYAAAVPAVLLTGLSKSGFATGFGALATPLIALTLPAPQATVSGFTSFVAHAGGPPIMFYLLPMKLLPRVMSAMMAVYFAVINLVKVVPYAALGLLEFRFLATSLLLLPLAPLGVWAGVWLVRRVSSAWFYRLAYLGMFLAGSKLLWDGLK